MAFQLDPEYLKRCLRTMIYTDFQAGRGWRVLREELETFISIMGDDCVEWISGMDDGDLAEAQRVLSLPTRTVPIDATKWLSQREIR